jgi:hypothetical protein
MTEDQLQAEIDRLREENSALKKMLRDNNICPYRMLPPGEHWSKCPAGFPGCGCADDIVLEEE